MSSLESWGMQTNAKPSEWLQTVQGMGSNSWRTKATKTDDLKDSPGFATGGGITCFFDFKIHYLRIEVS